MAHWKPTDDFYPTGEWKLYGEMCQQMWLPLRMLLDVFPKVEDARPGSKAGIQALSSVHVSIHNSRGLLQLCSECSKLYLALIGKVLPDKFEKERSALVENIKTLEELVVSELRSKLAEVHKELEFVMFEHDKSVEKLGEELQRIIDKYPNVTSSSGGGTRDEVELAAFYDVATKLGLNSCRTALVERRCLNRLVVQARNEKDEVKEKNVTCLLKLMDNCSKLYGTDQKDPDVSCSSPCLDDGSQMKGESEHASIATFGNQVLEGGGEHSGRIPTPPEEFKCPISLQLMYDPVVISSGQTFERVSIQKWLREGYTTCPKTRECLSHKHLTPNSCVKRLIESWCQENGVPVPANPPKSPDTSPFKSVFLELGASTSCTEHESEIVKTEDVIHKYKRWMDTLNLGERERWEERKQVVFEIRFYLKDDIQARVDMGTNGFVEELVMFLREAILEKDDTSQEVGALALFNLSVNNSRNKELMISAGIIPILDEMINSTRQPIIEAAIALYLNISCLNAARPLLVQTRMARFLIECLHSPIPLSNHCRVDLLYALFNLSIYSLNVPQLVESKIVPNLQKLVMPTSKWADKAMSILAYIAQAPSGNNAIRECPGLFRSMVAFLESEVPSEQEHSASCLLALCLGDERCVRMALQEGVIPSLIMIMGEGTPRAKDKADRLLKHFREIRTNELSGEQDVLQLDELRKISLKEIEQMEAQADQPQGPQERIRRNASANATSTGSTSGSHGSPKLSNSRSRRLGRTMVSMLKPKHFSRQNK